MGRYAIDKNEKHYCIGPSALFLGYWGGRSLPLPGFGARSAQCGTLHEFRSIASESYDAVAGVRALVADSIRLLAKRGRIMQKRWVSHQLALPRSTGCDRIHAMRDSSAMNRRMERTSVQGDNRPRPPNTGGTT